MFEDFTPRFYHAGLSLFLAWAIALTPSDWLGWWRNILIGAAVVLFLAVCYMLVHTRIVGNIANRRRADAVFLEAVRELDDHRLRTVGIHFPEWRIEANDETMELHYRLETTSVTAEFLVKLMRHPLTDGVRIAPVSAFPTRNGEQAMASEFHKLAQSRGWAREWKGNQTSLWESGWNAPRILALYGLEEENVIQNIG